MIRGIDYKHIFTSTQATRTISNVDLVKSELELLLGIQKYSLFFGNNIGVDLEKYLQLTNKTAAFNLIQEEIQGLFRKYKKARLVKTKMEFNNNTGVLKIELTVSLTSSNTNTFTIPLELSA